MPRKLEIPKVLPRIVGVQHTRAFFKEIRGVVDALPPNSTVGLELDNGHPGHYSSFPRVTALVQRIKQKSPSDYFLFSALAEYARRKGHSVYWLERPISHMVGHDRGRLKEAETLLGQFDEQPEHVRRERAVELFGHVIRLIDDARPTGLLHGRWRSSIMQRLLLRKRDWKPSDVIIVGDLHARDLSKALGTKIEKRIVSRGVRVLRPLILGFDLASDLLSRASRKGHWLRRKLRQRRARLE